MNGLAAGDLSNTVGMASTFKCGADEAVHHFFCILLVYEACGNAENVGVIVLSDKFSNLLAPADGGADLLVFIGGDGNAVSRAAEKYAKGKFAAFNSECNRVSKIGVIHRVGRVGSKVFKGKPFPFKKGDQRFFHFKSGMVTANRDRFAKIKG